MPRGSRQFDRPVEICVGRQFRRNSSSAWCNYNSLQTGLPPVFQGGDAVGVRANQNNPLNRSAIGIGRDVETDSHVHTFLLEDWLEIGVCQRSRGNRRSFGLEAAEFQYSAADREKILMRKCMQPCVARRKSMGCPGYRKPHSSLAECAVIIENPEDALIRRPARVSELLNKIRIVVFLRLPREDAKKPAINQHRNFVIWHKEESPRLRGRIWLAYERSG
jgi:hypothetical protein